MAGQASQGQDRDSIEREFLERLQQEMRRLTVSEQLTGVLQTLSALAFSRLGLTAETAADRDLEQSRLAIDAFKALTEVLAGVRPPDEVALYRSTLAQMQMAYVGQLERRREPQDTAEAPSAQAEPATDQEAPLSTAEPPSAGAEEPPSTGEPAPASADGPEASGPEGEEDDDGAG